ncbi:hypothetical protein [Acidisoma sp. S159]|nr:hypothetical protein [Acidisoma sp. S159]
MPSLVDGVDERVAAAGVPEAEATVVLVALALCFAAAALRA